MPSFRKHFLKNWLLLLLYWRTHWPLGSWSQFSTDQGLRLIPWPKLSVSLPYCCFFLFKLMAKGQAESRFSSFQMHWLTVKCCLLIWVELYVFWFMNGIWDQSNSVDQQVLTEGFSLHRLDSGWSTNRGSGWIPGGRKDGATSRRMLCW